MRTILLFTLMLLVRLNSVAQKAEKIYIHTDKDFYLPGETVWFKAYLLENKSLTSKTNLFTGLYDENGKLVSQKTYPVFNGAAVGDFTIPDSTLFSHFQLRVYTRNKEVSGVNDYILPLKVYQKSLASISTNSPGITSTIQVHPEGGKLVLGVNNHVIFKTNIVGQAAIIDETGKLVDSLFFDEMGFSRVQLTPLPNKRYFASIKNNEGHDIRQQLPEAQSNSVSLHSELAGNKLFYSINKNSNSDFLQKLTLTIREADEIIYTENLKLDNKMQFVNSFIIDSLGTGLFTLQLTDANQNLHQQKTIFIPYKYSPPEVQLRQVDAAAKAKNKIEVRVNDTTLTSWSVSVVDESFILPAAQGSIYDALVVGNPSSQIANALSNPKRTDLILTSLNIDKTPLQNLPDNYLSIAAKYNRNLPAGMALSIVINDRASGKQFYNFNQSSTNNFSAPGLLFYDSAKIYYQLTDKELTQNLTVAPTIIPAMPSNIQPIENKNWWSTAVKPAGMQTEEIENFIQQKPTVFNEVQTIKAVVVKSKYVNPVTKRILELDDKYASGMFKGLARGQQVNIIDDPGAHHMLDLFSYLPYRVPGVSVGRNSDGAKVFLSRSGTYVVFVDEVEMPAELIENISMSRIAYVKVIPGIVVGSSFVTDAGAIYIYTRRGDEDKSSLTMKSVMAKGYNLPGEFINPDYSDPKNARPPDYRTTLYWNPFVVTDKNNSTFTIEYYNNDISKTKILRLVGLTSEGTPIEIIKKIE